MDRISRENGKKGSQRTVPFDSSKNSAWETFCSPLNDNQDSPEGSTNSVEDTCPFCSCLEVCVLRTLWPDAGQADLQRSIFHEECQSCDFAERAHVTLCDFCKHLRFRHLLKCILIKPFVTSLLVELYPNTRGRGRTECDLCEFLTSAITRSQTGHPEAKAVLAKSMELCFRRFGDVSVEYTAANFVGRRTIRISNECQAQDPAADFERFVQWDIIREWLRECDEKHQSCANQPTLPTGFQVIDVDKRCVVQGTSRCKFVALSYVWGSRSMSASYLQQATRKNIESLKVPGALSLLPETVGDAIEICRKLGVNYLWVDRYCIVQDHEIHKHTQINAMADIFSSALLTVIACSGDYGVESCIPGIRRERQLNRPAIDIQDLHLRQELLGLDTIMLKSVWNSRGWTYQEAVLSRRNLIMAPEEVWLQCKRDVSRERNGPIDWSSWNTDFQESSAQNTRFEVYADNLQKYTQRKLGYDSDIYSAFDGIAHAIYGKDYSFHFGLPESHFDQALLWHCDCRWDDSHSTRIRSCEESGLVTRSWSWASITCGVSHHRPPRFCTTLVKWVLYKTQISETIAENSEARAEEIRSKELKAMDEPALWRLWRIEYSRRKFPYHYSGPCPQLLLALAIREGCIKTEKPIEFDDEEPLRYLKDLFVRRWPKYAVAYEEIRLTDPRQSSQPNGILFTKTQSALFHVVSGWIENTTELVIGSICQGGSWPILHKKYTVEAISLSVSEVGGRELEDVIGQNGVSHHEDALSKERYRGMTYFDKDGEFLYPVPVVNVMFIRWEDGYARRIGLGWIVLKQWGSIEWTLKDIWLK